MNILNAYFKNNYEVEKIVENYYNAQLQLDKNKITDHSLNADFVKEKVIQIIKGFAGVQDVLVIKDLKKGTSSAMEKKAINGYYSSRSGDYFIILKPGWIHDQKKGTTHGSGYSYDTHVPLIFMGTGISHGSSNQMVNIKDIAPTISTLINISFPNGTTGNPLRFE